MKTVLVTGGSGFLGGWCLVELLRGDYQVRTTVRDLGREAEVRARVESQVDPGDRLTFFAADLTSDDGWEQAVQGCDYVLHVASPFPLAQPKDPDELIVPAREGTLRVLRAALDAGVGRVVVTSSVAAVRGSVDHSPAPLTEEDWTDPDGDITPYTRSKTIAERAAWDLVKERGESEKLAVVNPGAILGPVLGDDMSPSLELVNRLLKGMPGTPRIGFNIVDVRDVVDLEIKAMIAPEAGGERFIAVTRFQWMSEVAAVLRERLGDPAAAKVPKRAVPNFVVRLMGIFDSSIRSIAGQLGQKVELSSAKAESVLGWKPRPLDETIVECAQSLVDAEGA